MRKSAVVDNASGKSVDSDIRTSTGTFFPMGHDDVITRIEKRVAQVSMIPRGRYSDTQAWHVLCQYAKPRCNSALYIRKIWGDWMTTCFRHLSLCACPATRVSQHKAFGGMRTLTNTSMSAWHRHHTDSIGWNAFHAEVAPTHSATAPFCPTFRPTVTVLHTLTASSRVLTASVARFDCLPHA